MKTKFKYQKDAKKAAAPRRALARKIKAGGKSWQEVGDILGVSRQRAQQIATGK